MESKCRRPFSAVVLLVFETMEHWEGASKQYHHLRHQRMPFAHAVLGRLIGKAPCKKSRFLTPQTSGNNKTQMVIGGKVDYASQRRP